MGPTCMLNNLAITPIVLLKGSSDPIVVTQVAGNHKEWDGIRIRLRCKLDMCILVQYGFLLRIQSANANEEKPMFTAKQPC